MGFEQNHRIGKKSQVRVLVDVPMILYMIAAMPMFVYVTTYVDYDPTVAIKGLLGISLGLIGLIMASTDQLGVGMVLDASFTGREVGIAITSIIVSFVAIFTMNIVVQGASDFYGGLSIVPIAGIVFSTLVGIVEEPFVHGWMQNVIENTTQESLAGMIISSAIMTVIHLAIYATKGMTVLVIVFLSFLIMSIVYGTSTEMEKGAFREHAVPCRRLSPLMTGHALVNFTSGLRAAMVVVRVMAVYLL